MNWIDFIQIALLLYLIERVSVIRYRYKLAISSNKPDKYGRGWWSLWIYCKRHEDEGYGKYGGWMIFGFYWGKQKKNG